MALVLRKEDFTDADFDEVQSFNCGDKAHQLEVSDWLKGPMGEDSALTAIHNAERPAKVYLYRLVDDYAAEDEEEENPPLVGFGALGKSEWRWTGKKAPMIPVTVLLWYGVQNEFKRQPPGDEKQFYSSLILEDLIGEAMEDQDQFPILGLCVRPESKRPIELYLANDFTIELAPFTDKDTGVQYRKMARILNQDRLLQILDEKKKA